MEYLNLITEGIVEEPEFVTAYLFFHQRSHLMTMARFWFHFIIVEREGSPKCLDTPSLTSRASHGHHENLVRELAEDSILYGNFTPLDGDLFNQIAE